MDMTSLAIFTRDLRLHDNPVLHAAAPDAVPVFIEDPIAETLHGSPNRQAYLAECLHDLDTNLLAAGSALVLRRGPWVDTVLALVAESNASAIHVARDVTAFSQRRIQLLRSRSPVPVTVHDSLTVVPPDALAPQTSDFYQVFTPFHRRWIAHDWRPMLAPPELAGHGIGSDPLPAVTEVGTSPARLHGGETAARLDMDRWVPRSRRYEHTRNDLGIDGTSHLSAPLHLGTLSPLEVALRTGEAGADAYVRQIAWRDFNHQVLFHRPAASSTNYRGHDVAWNDDPAAFEAWTAGATGFPIVDAAMRELTATGFIHNRARMVTASFLTKDLMIDWRLGARHFMTWLTDGDVANNQLGWQWVAGTGTDTNPTRIFNPTLQSERFDADGEYIRRWLPELAEVETDEIHDPSPLTRAATGYPLPIVDHREAIRAFKDARGFA